MAITRDQAFQQYKDAYGSNYDQDAAQDFEHAWANAGADSGGYQEGPAATKTWDQQMNDVRSRVAERFAGNTNYRQAGVDSQSAQGDALYGSGAGNPNNIPGQMGTATGYNGGPGFGAPNGPAGMASGGGGGSALSADSTAGQAGNLIQLLMQRMGGQAGAGGYGTSSLRVGGDPSLNPQRDALMSELQSLIAANKGGVSQQEVDANPETQAYRLASQRNFDRQRSQLAQRAAAEGTNIGGDFSGAADVGLGQLNQQRAEREGTYEGQLAGRMLTDKKDRLEKALSMSAGVLSDRDRLYLQAQLQDVNASIQQQQVGLGLLGQLMGNSHFYDQLGYGLGGQEASLNSGIMSQLY